MKYTDKLGLPIWNKPETDVFDIEQFNEGMQAVDDIVIHILNQINDLAIGDTKVDLNEYVKEEVFKELKKKVENKADKEEISSQLDTNKKKINGIKSNFEYELDEGCVIFTFDDWRGDLEEVYNVFKSRNVVFCAAIPGSVVEQRINEGLSLDLLDTLVSNDCEILAHGYSFNPITLSTPIETVISELEKPKRIFNKLGYEVEGFVKAGGEGATATLEPWIDIVKKYYVYGSGCGDNEPYKNFRLWLGEDMSILKLNIDRAIANKTPLLFYGHTINGTEGNLTKESLEEIIDYVLSKNIKITTLKNLYNNSGYGNLGEERYVANQDNIYNTQQIDILNKKQMFIAGMNNDYIFSISRDSDKIAFDRVVASKNSNISISDGEILIKNGGLYKIELHLVIDAVYTGQFKYLVTPGNIYNLTNINYNGYCNRYACDIRTIPDNTSIKLELWKNVDGNIKVCKDTIITITEL